MKRAGLFAAILTSVALSGHANLIWQEDFADVSDWSVIFNNLGGTATVTSDGALADFFVQSGGNEVAYGPNGSVSSYVPFMPANSSDYTLSFIVDSLTGSTSYDIRLDEFNATSNYLGTVFNVFPQGTFTGSTNVNLGSFSYNAGTAYVLPKITVFTGTGDQTVTFDHMQFDQIPEPMSAALLLAGFGGMLAARRAPRHRKDGSACV
jgi:hypothetical protein